MNPIPLHNHLWPGRGSNVRCLALLSVLCLFGCAIPAMAVPSPHIIRIVLVGDSTVADSSGWGLGFKCRVDPQKAQCINLAAGGRSSLSYLREKRWDDALGLNADYYLIQFGHNDQPGKPGVSTEPGMGYRESLIRYVEEAKAAGSQPVLITPLTRPGFVPWYGVNTTAQTSEHTFANYQVALDSNNNPVAANITDIIGCIRTQTFPPYGPLVHVRLSCSQWGQPVIGPARVSRRLRAILPGGFRSIKPATWSI